mgnify:CR=1 FL=1
MSHILIIDDDDQLRKSFAKLLIEEGHQVQSAASGEEGLQIVGAALPDVVVLDVRLPGMNGLETFRAIHMVEPKLPVIIMTAFSTTETAIEATKMGAFDYILKPFDIPAMLKTIGQALDTGRFMRSPVNMGDAPAKTDRDAIIGRSDAMQQVFKMVGRVASTDATVLIRGETGTGKELVARAIHQQSPRRERPFVQVNCAAIPDELIESELFGHEKGSFTGAHRRQLGKFVQADGGTLFLDEVGDMSLKTQAKVLRVLQDGEVEPVGAGRTFRVDVRVIAATNQDLARAVKESRFREDLYHRLNVIRIHLPALRERENDVVDLARHFLDELATSLGRPIRGFSDAALARLFDFGGRPGGAERPGHGGDMRPVLPVAIQLHAGVEGMHVQVFVLFSGGSGEQVHPFMKRGGHGAGGGQQGVQLALAQVGLHLLQEAVAGPGDGEHQQRDQQGGEHPEPGHDHRRPVGRH